MVYRTTKSGSIGSSTQNNTTVSMGTFHTEGMSAFQPVSGSRSASLDDLSHKNTDSITGLTGLSGIRSNRSLERLDVEDWTSEPVPETPNARSYDDVDRFVPPPSRTSPESEKRTLGGGKSDMAAELVCVSNTGTTRTCDTHESKERTVSFSSDDEEIVFQNRVAKTTVGPDTTPGNSNCLLPERSDVLQATSIGYGTRFDLTEDHFSGAPGMEYFPPSSSRGSALTNDRIPLKMQLTESDFNETYRGHGGRHVDVGVPHKRADATTQSPLNKQLTRKKKTVQFRIPDTPSVVGHPQVAFV